MAQNHSTKPERRGRKESAVQIASALGERIRFWRHKRRMSVTDLAQKAAFGQSGRSYISKIEHGMIHHISDDRFAAILNALGVSNAEFWGSNLTADASSPPLPSQRPMKPPPFNAWSAIDAGPIRGSLPSLATTLPSDEAAAALTDSIMQQLKETIRATIVATLTTDLPTPAPGGAISAWESAPAKAGRSRRSSMLQDRNGAISDSTSGLFARQLLGVLRRHGKNLQSLNTMTVNGRSLLAGIKIRRLQREIDGLAATSTIVTPDEIEAIASTYDFTVDEKHQLRAALFTEGVRHILLERMPPSRARHISQFIFTTLVDNQEAIEISPLEDSPKAHTMPAQAEEDTDAALEPGIDLYASAQMWLDMATSTRNRTHRKGYLAMARALLEEAANLFTSSANAAISLEQLEQWRQLIRQTQADILDTEHLLLW